MLLFADDPRADVCVKCLASTDAVLRTIYAAQAKKEQGAQQREEARAKAATEAKVSACMQSSLWGLCPAQWPAELFRSQVTHVLTSASSGCLAPTDAIVCTLYAAQAKKEQEAKEQKEREDSRARADAEAKVGQHLRPCMLLDEPHNDSTGHGTHGILPWQLSFMYSSCMQPRQAFSGAPMASSELELWLIPDDVCRL